MKMNRLPIKLISLLLLIALNGSMFLTVGETFGLFSDVEKNEDTTFEMGILDFSLNPSNDFSPDLKPTELTSSRTVDLSKDGTLGFKYKVKVQNAVGGLCSSLTLKDDLANTYQTLSTFISGETTFSATPSLTFTSKSSSYDASLQGKICDFDIVIEAWQDNLGDNTQGFTDIETINNTVKMGYWNSPIVLNEFLPNAGNYFEFIEFYNKGVSTVDMNGYYVMAGINRIDVNTTNTNTYSGPSTTIDPDGWLVITTGSDKLDDTSGTLTLYNSNGVEMDSSTYNASDYNINNNPGETNDMVLYLPFDNNTEAEDISGNNNNGSFKGCASIVAGGKINQALSLGGEGDYVEIPDSISLDIADEITLEAWVYAESWDNDDVWPVLDSTAENSILTKGGENSGLGAWSLHYKTESNGFRFELVDDETPSPLFENIPSTGLDQWYHVASTYDGSEMKLYINGALSNSTDAYTGLIKTNDEPLIIGKKLWYSSTYSYWDGMIDEVKIYNRALGADEVLEHYNDVGSSGAVPVDKSYARIPDGIGDWVDPIPTPGTPNKLSINETQTTFVAEEEIEFLPSVIELETSSPIPVEVIANTTTTDVVVTDIVVLIASTTEIVVSEATTTEPIIEVATTRTPTIIIATTTTVVAEIIEEIEQPTIEPIEGSIPIEGSAPVEEAIVEEAFIEEFIEEIEVVEEVVEESVEETPIIEEIITEETPVIKEELIILIDSNPVLDGNNQDSSDNQDSEDNITE